MIAELLRNGSFKPIVTFVRRLQPEQITTARAAGIELREILVAQSANDVQDSSSPFVFVSYMRDDGQERSLARAAVSLDGDTASTGQLRAGDG